MMAHSKWYLDPLLQNFLDPHMVYCTVLTDRLTDNAKTVSRLPLAGDRKQFRGRKYDLDHVLSFLCEGRHPLGNLSNLSQFHLLLSLHKHHHMGLDARKPVFGGLRTTQAQTSLRIRAV